VEVKRVDDFSAQQGGYGFVYGFEKSFADLVFQFCLLQLNQLGLNASIGRWMIGSVLDVHSASFNYDRILVFDEDQEIAVVGLKKFSYRFR